MSEEKVFAICVTIMLLGAGILLKECARSSNETELKKLEACVKSGQSYGVNGDCQK